MAVTAFWAPFRRVGQIRRFAGASRLQLRFEACKRAEKKSAGISPAQAVLGGCCCSCLEVSVVLPSRPLLVLLPVVPRPLLSLVPRERRRRRRRRRR